MTDIHFILKDGQRRTVQAEDELSLMVAAVDNDIEGIDAICHGCCSCGTCHIVLTQDALAKIVPPYSGEQQVLDCLPNAETGSRLACQIVITPALAGIRVRVKS